MTTSEDKSSTQAHHLLRELGLKEGIAIGPGTMIGVGIFALSALAAERAGPASAGARMGPGTPTGRPASGGPTCHSRRQGRG